MTYAQINEEMISKDPEVAMLKHEIDRLKRLLEDNGILHSPQNLEQKNTESLSRSNQMVRQSASHRDVSQFDEHAEVDAKEVETSSNLVLDVHAQEPKQRQNDSSYHDADELKVTSYDMTSGELAAIAALGERNSSLQSQNVQPEQLGTDDIHLPTDRWDPLEMMHDNHELNAPLVYNATCKRIVNMLSSVLVLVDAFLASVVAPTNPNTRAEEYRVDTLPTWHADVSTHSGKDYRGEEDEMTSHLLAHSEVTREKRRQSSIPTPSNRSSKSSLSTLLSRRKQLKGESEESRDKDEAQLKEELTKMRKKKAQKLELREWLLEKEQKAENPVSFYMARSNTCT